MKELKRKQAEFPFEDYWMYLEYSKGIKRYRVCLHHKTNKQRKKMSYARYLLSTKLGRELEKHEHVDHIDGNPLNDTIDNLQILSIVENNRKYIKQSGRALVTTRLNCPSCLKEFEQSIHLVTWKRNKGQKIYCSRKCCLDQTSRKSISLEIQQEIYKLHQVDRLSSYAIAERLHIARNTVMKYWK